MTEKTFEWYMTANNVDECSSQIEQRKRIRKGAREWLKQKRQELQAKLHPITINYQIYFWQIRELDKLLGELSE